MEEQRPHPPTLLEQTQDIRAKYQRGEITPAEAKRLIKPYYDAYVARAQEKAREAGMRAPKMSLEKFLARRSDLRDVAQRQVMEQQQADQ